MNTPSERVQRLREAADYIDKDGPWTSRWDRAADETHDLLALLFERHREVVSRFGPNTCWGDSKPFPCPMGRRAGLEHPEQPAQRCRSEEGK